MASFKDQMKKFNAKAEKAATLVFRGTALSLFSQIVTRTPVDTGRLRGNWQAGINSPADSGGDSAIGALTLGDTVFITNNLPYAQVIESGSSKQAPNGMVAVTITEFQRIIKAQAGKHKV